MAARVHLLILCPERAWIKPRSVDERSPFFERGLTTSRADKELGRKGPSRPMVGAEPATYGSFVTLL
jgi:hypothetical protein